MRAELKVGSRMADDIEALNKKIADLEEKLAAVRQWIAMPASAPIGLDFARDTKASQRGIPRTGAEPI